ncbi:Uncharacterized protein APZ42_015285 [Daphnia magna]|uniref:Uncharacterized protein n=2 Tax=Daphnia magna TaxID=35525 RepID=A0A162PBS3_9CRUS|nr:Uncharacterized protein APZ42_015285 [Daphnia magna]
MAVMWKKKQQFFKSSMTMNMALLISSTCFDFFLILPLLAFDEVEVYPYITGKKATEQIIQSSASSSSSPPIKNSLLIPKVQNICLKMTFKIFIMLAVLCAVTFMGDARPSNGGYGYPPRTVSLPVLPPGSFGPLAPMGARSSALLDDSSELDDLEDMDPLEMALNPLGTLDKVLGGGGGGGGGYKKTLILG